MASSSAAIFLVTTLPAPTIAPSPIVTGATSALFEPMKAPSPITVEDRTFYFGSAEGAAQAQQVADVLAAESEPGERLIAGPTDLSRTNYNDSFFYFLFPDLVPGTRYIEMDPGIANTEDSGLADQLRANDWLILSRSSDLWRHDARTTTIRPDPHPSDASMPRSWPPSSAST